MILDGMASGESTTRDPVELARQMTEASNRGDIDAWMSFFAPDAVWDMSPMDMGLWEGCAAIRSFREEWGSAYDDLAHEVEAILDLGNGVVFAVVTQRGRPAGSAGEVNQQAARVSVTADGLIERITSYPDIDEARAVAERLAEERG